MDTELVCNFKKCRKRLGSFAWVTSCSHIFCDEDGTREFSKTYTCPACENSLSGKFDIIRIDLQPTDKYKSMVLAGHKPETIMEICTRALSFWTYQAHQERIYQEYVSSKAKDKALQLEQYYEQMVTRTQAELTSLKSQLSTSKKDLETVKNKYNEITDKLTEKNRQYQKLQTMYDAMRRKCITPATFEGGDRTVDCRTDRCLNNFSMPLSSGDVSSASVKIHFSVAGKVFKPERCSLTDQTFHDLMVIKDLLKKTELGRTIQTSSSRTNSPLQRNFVLRPSNTPVMSSLPCCEFQQSRFNLPFGTPK